MSLNETELLRDCLIEVTQGVGSDWSHYPVLGATRDGLAPAKEPVGKAPERYKLVEPGTVFYNPMRIMIGSIAMVDEGEPTGITSPDYVVVRTRPGVLHHRFFYYWLRSSFGEEMIRSLARGAVRERMLFNRLAEGEIRLPRWCVQQQIADALAVVPRARRAAQERLAAAEALPAAYYREFFGEVAPFSAAPAVPTEPTKRGWSWFLLTDLARLATGHTPSRRHPEYWEGDIPWLQLPDIRALDGRRAMQTSEFTNQLGINSSAAVLLPADTVCMSRTASVGFVTILGRPMATSQDFVNWVCGPELVPEFLMRLLIACRQPIRDLGSGAVHNTIYFPTVQAFSVCVPPVTEQRRIVIELSRRLDEADKLIARLRDELALIEALPAALLRRAFGDDGAAAGGD